MGYRKATASTPNAMKSMITTCMDPKKTNYGPQCTTGPTNTV